MIDWSKFNLNLGYYDNPLILEVIEMFIEDYPQRISALKKSVEDKDFHQIDENAHYLKTNCRTFGDDDAAELAFVLEKIGKKVFEADMNEILGRFVVASEQLLLELKKYREKLSS
jgi:HPt (histidine-containing phosphotransfer) domain-containing protein